MIRLADRLSSTCFVRHAACPAAEEPAVSRVEVEESRVSGGTARVASEGGVTGRKEVTSGVAAADECVCVCVCISLVGSPDRPQLTVFPTIHCPSPPLSVTVTSDLIFQPPFLLFWPQETY